MTIWPHILDVMSLLGFVAFWGTILIGTVKWLLR